MSMALDAWLHARMAANPAPKQQPPNTQDKAKAAKLAKAGDGDKAAAAAAAGGSGGDGGGSDSSDEEQPALD
jgi:hypothetical protein